MRSLLVVLALTVAPAAAHVRPAKHEPPPEPEPVLCDEACVDWWLASLSPAERGQVFAWWHGHDWLNWISRSRPDAPLLRFLRVCETGWVDGVHYPDGKADHYTATYEGPMGFTHTTYRVYSEQLGVTPGDGWPVGAHVAEPWQVDLISRHLIDLYGMEPWPICGAKARARGLA